MDVHVGELEIKYDACNMKLKACNLTNRDSQNSAHIPYFFVYAKCWCFYVAKLIKYQRSYFKAIWLQSV